MNTFTRSTSPKRNAMKPLAAAIICAVTTSGALAEGFAIEEVVVTAEKIERSLQETSIAITAYNEDSLENIGATGASDVGEYIPNVNLSPSMGGNKNIRMSIRGLGTAEPAMAVDPKVGIYLDGVYMARNSGAVLDVVDLSSMEVLRGPQGTLWGKNTTGGAINMTTVKPKGEFGFKQKLTMGEDGLFKSLTSVDTPTWGALSGKLTYAKKSYDGWATNISSDAETDLGSDDTDAARLALRFTPTDDLTIDYSYDYSSSQSVAAPNQVGTVSPELFGADSTVGTTIDLRAAEPFGIYVGNVYEQMAAEISNGRRDQFDLDGAGVESVRISGHNLTAAWDTDNFTLKSITGFRKYDQSNSGLDLDSGAYEVLDGSDTVIVPIFHTSGEKNQHQFSQEFQILGSAFDDRLNYVSGLYYFTETGEENVPWEFNIYSAASYAGGTLLRDMGDFYKIESSSKAAFTQLAYDWTERFTLTLGMRYSTDEKELTLFETNPSLDQNYKSKKDWSKFTTSLTASFQLTDDVHLYAKRAEGYASGVYNPGTIDAAARNAGAALTPLNPEDITSYEIGMKSMWWDNRLLLNTAYFYNDNQNLQVTDLVDAVRVSSNSGSNTGEGFEIDGVLRLTESLTFNASYGEIEIDNKGREVAQTTPERSGSAGIEYVFPAMDVGELSARLDMTHTSASGFSSADPETRGASRTLYNGRIALDAIEAFDGEVRVALWGKNLTDEEYIVHGANFSFFRSYVWGAPRSVGVDLTYNY